MFEEYNELEDYSDFTEGSEGYEEDNLQNDATEKQPSNLTTDPELTLRFQETATRFAWALKYRFYQVFEEMEVDDVVSECWQKIIRQSISYDEEKANFNTFVRMIVTQRLIELTRTRNRIDRIPYLVSIDQEIDNGTSTSNQSTTRADLIPDERSEAAFVTYEIMSEIHELTDLFNTIPKLEEIVELFIKGYSFEEVINITGVNEGWVMCARRVMAEIRKNRRGGTAKSLADIMYGESQEWELDIVKDSKDKDGKPIESKSLAELRKRDIKRKNHVTDFCWMITDKETGINLADIVRLVLRGFNYKKICKKLESMTEDFLDTVTGKPIMVDAVDSYGNLIYDTVVVDYIDKETGEPVTFMNELGVMEPIKIEKKVAKKIKKRVLKYPDRTFNEYTVRHVLEKYEEILI